MKFFFDNCTSPHHARGLHALAAAQHYEMVHLRDRFPPNTEDVDWIRALGAEGDWIIISGDTRITRNPVERAAWHESELTAFFFGEPWANAQYWKQAEILVGWWSDIALQARKTPTGHGFLIPKGSRQMKQIYPAR